MIKLAAVPCRSVDCRCWQCLDFQFLFHYMASDTDPLLNFLIDIKRSKAKHLNQQMSYE